MPVGAASSERVVASLPDAIARLDRRLRQTRPLGELTQSQLSALTSGERETLWRAGQIVDQISLA
jgi:hypothetical protein